MKQMSERVAFASSHAEKLKGQKILIVGDVGIDEYLWGEVKRISPEAPVPVVEVEREEKVLGLSGNVVANVSSLGGEAFLVSVVGKDAGAEMLRGLLRDVGVKNADLIEDADRPTTRKARVMAQTHHICRVDYELRRYLTAEVEDRVLAAIEKVLPKVDIVVLQDYAKGVIGRRLVEKAVQMAHAAKKLVLVDPNPNTAVEVYRGADLMTPNTNESMALAREASESLRGEKDTLNRVGRRIMDAIGSKRLIITRGKDGMRLFEDEKITDMPTFAREVFDVTGAGDTVIATLAMGLSAGFSLEEACVLANFAAGVVVGKMKCGTCTVPELVQYAQNSR